MELSITMAKRKASEYPVRRMRKNNGKFPNIGETAKPGNAFKAEIDHIPTRVIRGIVPRPVCILIKI